MFIGQSVLIKHEGIVQEAIVEIMYMDTLKVRLVNGAIIEKKYWEVRKIQKEADE